MKNKIKHFKFFTALLVLVILILACGKTSNKILDKDYTIVVTNSVSNAGYTGSILEMNSTGDSKQRSVSGDTKGNYKVRGSVISCSFQNSYERGTLTVTIYDSENKVIKEESTSAAYGVVTLAVGR